MRESGYYPPGAEFDPDAPWNQSTPIEEPFAVTVSITMSKTFTINVPNPVHMEEDEDGKYLVSDREPITEEDVRSQCYLPDEVLKLIAENKDFDSKFRNVREDCSGWNVDECEVIED